MRFRPCIDIHNKKVKQIVGGTLKDDSKGLVENFISEKSPAEFAEMYKRDGLTGGHVIMLGPGNEEAAISALKAYSGGLQIGGGINPDNAKRFLDAGASHVIVTSYVFKDGNINFDNLFKIREAVGYKHLVLDLSCRRRNGWLPFIKKYAVVTDRWQKFTEYEINEKNINELSDFCSEFLVHGADVEGLCNGIEEDLVKKLGKWQGIPVTYAGGIRDFDDLETIKRLGKGKIDFTIGSALDIFGGNLAYRDVVSWAAAAHKADQNLYK